MKSEYKIIAYLSLIIFVFVIDTLVPLLIVSALCIVAALFFALNSLKRSAKFVTIILVFTFLSNLFFHHGKVIIEFVGLYITEEGLVYAVFITSRLFILIIGAQILNGTTSSEELLNGITRLIGPLGRVKLVKELLTTTALTLQLLPSILEEVKEICTISGDVKKGFVPRVRYASSLIVGFFVRKLKEGQEHKDEEARKIQ